MLVSVRYKHLISIVAATVICAIALPAGVPAQAAGIKQGPDGLSFYSPPESEIDGRHGSAIWQRKLKKGSIPAHAARGYLVLYRSVNAKGEDVAVSGTIYIPRGKPPKGGWPVMSWGHGTTGVADICAPSRLSDGDAASLLYLDAWIKLGYAVAATDYQGLGTAGPHPYLIGVPEGRSVIDMVSAARRIDPSLGRSWMAIGHSQGGHAVLFADRYGPGWGKGIRMVGTVALAPASHLSSAVKVLRLVRVPTSLSAFIPLVITGVKTEIDLDISSILGPTAVEIYGQAESKCLSQLVESDSWGGLAPYDAIKPEADLGPALTVIDANDPSNLKLRVPVFVAQGSADTVVFPSFTTSMVKLLRKKGSKVKYKIYPGSDHGTVLTASFKDVARWMKARFAKAR